MNDILLVEDNDLLCQAYKMILEKHGFRVTIALNGADALEKLKTLHPQVILLDILMPIMDGIEFLKQFKSSRQNHNLKIILLTNLSDEKLLKQALKLGANKHILKTDLNPYQLVQLVKGVI